MNGITCQTLTPAETAIYLGVSVSTVYDRIKTGVIPILPLELTGVMRVSLRWLEQQTNPVAASTVPRIPQVPYGVFEERSTVSPAHPPLPVGSG